MRNKDKKCKISAILCFFFSYEGNFGMASCPNGQWKTWKYPPSISKDRNDRELHGK